MHKRMHVLLEGRDDREFFDGVIRPILQGKYEYIHTWEYAEKTIERRINYLRSVRAMKADYLFINDIDTSPCITQRKRHLVDSHRQMIDANCTIIVVREIESWYLAGVDDGVCLELGIPIIRHTDDVTKERFRSLVPARFRSVADLMAEILRVFRVDTARGKNRSFGYLMDKLEARSKKV